MKILKIFIWVIIVSASVWALFIYQPPEPPEDKDVLTFAIWGGIAEEAAWREIIKGFETKHPDIKIDLMMVSFKYNEKMLSLLAANIAPDIFVANPFDLIPKGVIRPIDDMIAKDPDFDKDSFYPGILEMGKYFGKTYNITPATGTMALFYNVKHFKDAGIPTPTELHEQGKWNWETFVETCKKLKQTDDNGRITRWPYRVYAGWMMYHYPFINGGNSFKNNYRETNFRDPKVIEGYQKIADLIIKEKLAPPPSPDEHIGSSAWQEFARGKISMMTSGPWMVSRLSTMMDDPYDIAWPPMEPGGRISSGAGMITGMWVNSKYPEACYKWFKYIWGQEARIIWSRLGFDYPMLKELHEHPDLWINKEIVPPHYDLFLDLSLNFLQPPIAFMNNLPYRVHDHMTKTVWDEIRYGYKTAEQALLDAEPIIQKMLDEKYHEIDKAR